MKRRLLPILMTLVLVCALPIWAAFVTSGDVTNPLLTTADATEPLKLEEVSTADDLRAKITAGNSVKLTNNIDINTALNVTSTLTLDLNGCTLRMTGNTSVFYVYNNATLTIQDSSAAKSGTITGGNAGDGGGVYIGDNSSEGHLVMTGGTITGGKGPYVTGIYYVGGAVFLENDTTLKLEGGTITGETVGVRNNLGTFTMTGGRITGCYEQGVYMSTGWMEMSEAAYIGGNNMRNTKEDIFIEETLQTSARLSVTGGTINGNVRIKFWWNSGMTKDKLGEVDTVVQGANVLDGHIKVEIGTSGICVDYNTVNFIDEVANTRTLKLVLQPNAVEKPETPATVNGREFMYWTKEGASEAWDFNTEIKVPLTLYAVRTPASSGGYYYYPTPDTKADDAKGSPKTADPGVALYAALSLLSLTGLTCTAKKR